MRTDYDALIASNWGFLSEADQPRVAETKVLLAGCGLGSNIAVLAARTGFCHFVLADGDAVETGNLNRQAFRRDHVGQNKASATADLIKEVNPQAQVKVIPGFLQAKDAEAVVQQCHVVVNMVDPGPALHALLRAARAQGKVTLFPLNVGFGGVLLAFGPDSLTLEESVDSGEDGDLFLRILEKVMPSLPRYLWQFAWVAEKIQREKVPPPQLGIAASVTASLVVGSMVQVALGSSPPLFPSIAALDTREPAVLTWPMVQERS